MGYRGSKSAISKSIVKEQRVDGNYFGLTNPRLRCTLTGLKRDYLIKCYNGLCPTACVYIGMARVSNQINRSMLYSSLITAQSKKLGNMNPFFITGGRVPSPQVPPSFLLHYIQGEKGGWRSQGEGSFTLSIRSSDKYTSK